MILGVPWVGWAMLIIPNVWGVFLWWLIRRLSRERRNDENTAP